MAEDFFGIVFQCVMRAAVFAPGNENRGFFVVGIDVLQFAVVIIGTYATAEDAEGGVRVVRLARIFGRLALHNDNAVFIAV